MIIKKLYFKENDLIEFNNKRGVFICYNIKNDKLGYISIDNELILVEVEQLRKLERKFKACKHCICLNCKKQTNKSCKIMMCILCKIEKEALDYVTRHFDDIIKDDVLVSCREEDIKNDWIDKLFKKVNSYDYEYKMRSGICKPTIKYCPVCGTKSPSVVNDIFKIGFYCNYCGYEGILGCMEVNILKKYKAKRLLINDEIDYGFDY